MALLEALNLKNTMEKAVIWLKQWMIFHSG